MMIKSFLETFKNKKNKPALILKTSSAISCIMDREYILKKIDDIRKTVKGDLPNVYLLHGEIDDKDINDLYNHNKVKAMINLTKGEGFGRPLLEFSVIGKPIIASSWSGHLDFLSPEFSCLVKGEIKQIHPSAVVPNMLIPESGWFTPDYVVAGLFMKDVYEDYEKYLEKAKRQAYRSKTEFSFDKMVEKLDQILTKNLPEFPKPVTLKLPQIKKIELPNKVNV
jgi:glycosyltransferase involved in cell wall biosynthesis